MWLTVIAGIVLLMTAALGCRAVVRPFPPDARRQRQVHGVLLLVLASVGVLCQVFSARKQAATAAELQELKKPRRISMEQSTRLIELLKQAPKGHLKVYYLVGDTEGLGFARQIKEVLDSSGWSVGPVNALIDPGNDFVGVRIRVHSRLKAPPFAAVVQRAFDSVGIRLAGEERADFPEDAVWIVVGNKPLSAFTEAPSSNHKD